MSQEVPDGSELLELFVFILGGAFGGGGAGAGVVFARLFLFKVQVFCRTE